MKSEELLAHADFVRALARSLVIDENRAADVEQRTWLAALEHPPASFTNPRSWFARVARNFVVTMYRGDARRQKYEKDQASEEKITTPEEVAMRKEALRQMSNAVLTLEEPYFSTILLRFYEDLPPREVAARLDVPVETVKTRIQRALKILRHEMDEENGGIRTKWCMALAPIAGLHLATAKAAAATTTATVGTAKLKIGIVAALFLGTTFTLLQLLPDSKIETGPEVADPAALEVSSAMDGGMEVPPFDEEGYEQGSLVVSNAERVTLEPSGLLIAGRVTDQATGAPLPSFDFKVYQFKWSEGWSVALHETVHHEEGRFSFPLPEGGHYDLALWANRYQMKRVKRLKIFEAPGKTDLEVKLDPGYAVTGRVVDDATGRPVEGAIVGPAVYAWETDLVMLRIANHEQAGTYDYTDAGGNFSLRGLREVDYLVAAAHPDYAEGSVKVEPGAAEPVTVRLKDGFRISGQAFDDNGEPAEGVLIRMYGDELPICRPVMTGPDGRYRSAPLRPGRVFLRAGAPPTALKIKPAFTEEHKVADVADQDLEVNFGVAGEHVTWRGRLLGYDGQPVSRGLMVMRPAMYSPHDSKSFRLYRYFQSDGEGRFEVPKLLPGRYNLDLDLPREHRFDWGMIAFKSAGPVERDIDLSLSDALSGVVVDSATGSPMLNKRGSVFANKSTGERKRYGARIDKEGRFEIRNVLPGSYTLQAMVQGRYSKHLVGIEVGQGKRAADLEIPITQGGWLKLKYDGFDQEETPGFSLSVSGGDSDLNLSLGDFNFVEGGSRETTHPLETGRWTASLSFRNLGYVERRFEILPGEVTEVVVFRSETVSYEGALSLIGVVSHVDGSSSAGTRVLFKASSVPGLSRDNRELEGLSDDKGNFSIQGLKPGRWRVHTRLPDGVWNYLPELRIPADANDPFEYNLVIPGGAVSGLLHDRESGQAFVAGRPREWNALLEDVKRHREVAGLRGGGEGGRFEFKGIPDGEYQLEVEAEGYELFRSGPFTVRNGRAVDLGKVELDPCGVLDLEVLDSSGSGVQRFRVTCDGRHRRYDKLPGGIRRYDKLPLGSITFTIEADGFLEQDFTVQLEPARPVEARVTLRPE